MTDLESMQKVLLHLKEKNYKLITEPDFMRLWYVVTFALEMQKQGVSNVDDIKATEMPK